MKNRSVSARHHLFRLVLDALLVAIHVVWGMVPSEFSWSSLPVLLCAFLIGPFDAITVALLGSFIEQLRYGINATTPLWMLPWLLMGAVAGLGAWLIRKNPRVWQIVITVVLSELVLNVANTAVLCSLGYLAVDFTAAPLVLVGLFIGRMPQAIVRAILSSIVVPLLLPPLRKAMARQQITFIS